MVGNARQSKDVQVANHENMDGDITHVDMAVTNKE